MPFARSRFAVSTRRVLGEVRFADRGTSRSNHQRSASTPNRCDEVDRVDRIAERLADLAAVRRHVVVDEQLGRERAPGRRAGSRARSARGTARCPCRSRAALATTPSRHHSSPRRGAEVVDERVEPDVDDLVGIAGHRDPPAAGPRSRPRDADVADVAGEERRAPRCARSSGTIRSCAGSDQRADRAPRSARAGRTSSPPRPTRVARRARRTRPSTNCSQPAQYQPAYGARYRSPDASARVPDLSTAGA